MSGIFGGHSVFGAQGGSVGYGGFFDDLFDSTEDVAGATGTPSGGSTTDATVITGTASTPAKHSAGAMPKIGSCLKPYIDDPVNPGAFCILDPKGNYTCPANQIYDVVEKKCVPYKPDLIQGAVPQTGVICPYGTKAVGAACVSLVTPGATGGTKTPVPQPTPGPGPSPMINGLGGGTVEPWMIALAAGGLVLLVGGAIYAKKRQDKSGRGGKKGTRAA